MMNNFAFKGFDLSFLLYADYGRTIKNEADMGFNGRANQPRYDYWTPNNPNGRYPQPYRDAESPTTGSTYIAPLRYEDGSFLRMREITLGYTLWHISLVKLSLNAAVCMLRYRIRLLLPVFRVWIRKLHMVMIILWYVLICLV